MGYYRIHGYQRPNEGPMIEKNKESDKNYLKDKKTSPRPLKKIKDCLMIELYEDKWDYLVSKYGNRCPIGAEKDEAWQQVTDLYHRCHNTKWRREKFPLFLNSLLNLMPVSNRYHLKFPSYGKISDMQAEKWQKFLSNPIHWKCKMFVNKLRWP